MILGRTSYFPLVDCKPIPSISHLNSGKDQPFPTSHNIHEIVKSLSVYLIFVTRVTKNRLLFNYA